ncbi:MULTISPECIES: hypothetical protein [Clostridium]|uniref:Uncharacterized protein n=1 Tax=Clostridium cibarium TaxID=2762247 RepID=A0ABR8PTX4_9CLOT|nr:MULTISPECIES: hypothetical protein [Clostridium]MBD7911602.1 hypothetical protein [Clostridium cibarium]
MNKKEVLGLTSLAFSIGVVFGFIISPVKNGVGNNSGNTTNNYYNKEKSSDNEEIPSVAE